MAFVVVTEFRSKDQMTKDLQKMGLSAKNFGKIAGLSFRKAETSALSLKRVIGGILGAAALRRGFSMLTQGVRGVVEEFVDFDDAITAASAKFNVFDRESETFKELARTAREVGATTEFTSPQAAEGLRFLAKAGWEANEAMQALPSFVNLATASEMDFARAADIATDVMGAFQLRGKDSAENLRNLTRVNDVMARAVNMSNIDMEDLFETMKFAGPIATTAGVSLEKFAAMAAFVGGAGIKGSLGGTALRTMFLSLAAPTDKIKNKFKSLGIQLQDARGNLMDPVKILGQLQTKFKDMGTAQKAAALNLIFGKRAVSGAAVSMEGANDSLLKFEQTLKDAGGQSKKMAEFMRQSLSKRFATLKSAAIELGFKIIDAFEKKIPGGIDAAIEAVRQFDVKPIIEGIESILDKGAKFLDWLKEAKRIAKDYSGVLIGIGVAFAAWRIGAVVGGLIQVFRYMAALKALGGMSAIMSATGALGPLGVIAFVVAGIAAGVYTLWTRWDDFTRALGWMADDISAWFTKTANSITGAFLETWINIKSGAADFFLYVIKMMRKIHLDKIFNLDAAEKMIGGWKQRDATVKQFTTASDINRRKQLEIEGSFSKQKQRENARKYNIGLGEDEDVAAKSGLGGAGGLGDLFAGLGAPDMTAKTAPGGISWDEFATNLAAQGGALDFNAPIKTDKNFQARQAEKAKAEKSSVDFRGRLDIAGAPAGSKMTSKTKGAPPIRTEMLGANR